MTSITNEDGDVIYSARTPTEAFAWLDLQDVHRIAFRSGDYEGEITFTFHPIPEASTLTST